jgi:hypothetical protein
VLGTDRVSVHRGVVTVIVRKRHRKDHWYWSALSQGSSGSSTLWSFVMITRSDSPKRAINPG